MVKNKKLPLSKVGVALSKFLASQPKSIGGRICSVCNSKNRNSINESLIVFNKAKETGQTCVPWSSFVGIFLKNEFDYDHEYRTVHRHLERCLKIKVAK
mgnify:CR=1 FL=1